ncbi:hypothetical protein Tco_1555378 [Tanacetum coccineum]
MLTTSGSGDATAKHSYLSCLLPIRRRISVSGLYSSNSRAPHRSCNRRGSPLEEIDIILWAITPVVPWIPTFIASEGSLIPSGSRISTIPGHVANLLAISALYSTWPIIVKLAPVAQ